MRLDWFRFGVLVILLIHLMNAFARHWEGNLIVVALTIMFITHHWRITT
jgi:hypothetical protein